MQAIEVETTYGWIKGRKDTSNRGKYYYAFEEIPYAVPPVGECRFLVSTFLLHNDIYKIMSLTWFLATQRTCKMEWDTVDSENYESLYARFQRQISCEYSTNRYRGLFVFECLHTRGEYFRQFSEIHA